MDWSVVVRQLLETFQLDKSTKQLRQHYFEKSLDPAFSKAAFTPQEKKLLRRLFKDNPGGWAAIAKLMSQRSAYQVKSQCRFMKLKVDGAGGSSKAVVRSRVMHSHSHSRTLSLLFHTLTPYTITFFIV